MCFPEIDTQFKHNLIRFEAKYLPKNIETRIECIEWSVKSFESNVSQNMSQTFLKKIQFRSNESRNGKQKLFCHYFDLS